MKKPVSVVATIRKAVKKAREKGSGPTALEKLKKKKIDKKRKLHYISVTAKAQSKVKRPKKPFHTVAFKKRRTYK